jgi:hypothetical protein
MCAGINRRTQHRTTNHFAHSSTLASVQGNLSKRASEQYCQMSDIRAHTLDASNQNTNYWLGSINALKFSWAQTWLFLPANITVNAQTDAGAIISSSTQQNQAYYMCYIAQ